jgi:protein-L-isoaspartate(D-aspartate) O-methyltransferase
MSNVRLRMSDRNKARRAFAEEFRVIAGLKSERLVEAFADVPREHYLGSGPWSVVVPGEDWRSTYRLTETANPEETYRNVAIAIDPSRGLHNGHPEALARWMDHLQLAAGDSVVHVGAGTGYYTAILAAMVGPTGHVAAFEIDPVLAEHASTNLQPLPQVELSQDAFDGAVPGQTDAIFVTCGATQIPLKWLECIRIGGRMVLPITASLDDSGMGYGAMFLVAHRERGFSVRHISPAAFFPCIGRRNQVTNRRLLAKSEIDWLSPKSIRLDAHIEDSTCWLHSDECCLSCSTLHDAPAED